jgi:hypothetical protein
LTQHALNRPLERVAGDGGNDRAAEDIRFWHEGVERTSVPPIGCHRLVESIGRDQLGSSANLADEQDRLPRSNHSVGAMARQAMSIAL